RLYTYPELPAIVNGKNRAEWLYVIPEARESIFNAFTLPTVRHVTVRDFISIPLTPFVDCDLKHLKSLSLIGVYSSNVEDEAPFPLKSRHQADIGGQHPQLEILDLGRVFMDNLQLLSSCWFYKGSFQEPLTEELRLDTTFKPPGDAHKRWQDIPEEFLHSIRRYEVTNRRPRLFDTSKNMWKIHLFSNLLVLRVVLDLDVNLDLDLYTDIQVPFHDLVAEIQRAELAHLEEFQLDLGMSLNWIEGNGLGATLGLPWGGLDAALAARSAYPSLRRVVVYLNRRESEYSVLDGGHIRPSLEAVEERMPLTAKMASFQLIVLVGGGSATTFRIQEPGDPSLSFFQEDSLDLQDVSNNLGKCGLEPLDGCAGRGFPRTNADMSFNA
ncbi:hypothetical protein FA15DRAFT_727969, partial [Coprinopsis marcescibilis]